ncbi:MAG TPA: tRNA (adenosine(37)-N6)-dimethylallyltransferase MiaA [Vicinamibacteria bacterium]|nr:tRNA (adenosine(37)-N6)-dimethylallyltransferase MiaA [Vicinamibacteria bacterium]
MAAAPPPLAAIVGPTASGKSALALRLARARGGEVVSCDSLQVYRGLDIGSAKPTPEERRQVRHHLVDVAEPEQAFSAAAYVRLAREALAEIARRGALPVVAGGTGLYLRALLVGLFEGPSRDAPLRQRFSAIAERHGELRLHRLLAAVDPAAAGRIHPRDRVRTVRALEVYWTTRRPISEHQAATRGGLSGFRVGVFGLRPPRAKLRQSVERRTRGMLERGLLDEVRALLARGLSPELSPLRAIGYRQAVAVVRGELAVEAAEAAIVTETMRYAKRQMTWFRHQQPGVSWFEDPEAAYQAIIEWLDRPGADPGGLGGPKDPPGHGRQTRP